MQITLGMEGHRGTAELRRESQLVLADIRSGNGKLLKTIAATFCDVWEAERLTRESGASEFGERACLHFGNPAYP